MRPHDLPPAERYAHGTRSRYVTGCRCDACREANRLYYHERQAKARAAALELAVAPVAAGRLCPGIEGEPCKKGVRLRKDSIGGICSDCRVRLTWNGLVPAARAREHLLKLSEAGVGRRAVEAASDIASSILSDVFTGKAAHIRRDTERRILQVDELALADHSLVPARPTLKRIRELVRLGYTRGELAQRLGYVNAALQLKRGLITARNAHRVERLHREVLAEVAANEAMPDICPDCGYSHAEPDRLRAIETMAELAPREIVEQWSCFYGDGEAGQQRLYRDLRKRRERRAEAA
jgi:hypothetical protein